MNASDSVIDGIPFLNALIVDNRRSDIEALEEDFNKKKISVTFAASSTEAESIIKLKPEINLVILDWFLDEESDTETKMLLNLLKVHSFAPVIIYTEQGKESPTSYIKQAHLERIAMVLDKSEVKGDTVFSEISKWLAENPELKIFLIWSKEVKKRLIETLWAVYNLDVGGLRALVELLRNPEGLAQTTREQDLIDFFGEVLTKKLVCDGVLLGAMKNVVEKLLSQRGQVALDVDKLRVFHAFERYKQPCETLWTGSVLQDSQAGTYYVVVTPACDFCHEDRIENFLLVEAEPLSNYVKSRPRLSKGQLEACIKNQKDIVHYLPYIPNLPEGLVCRFDRICNKIKDELKRILADKKINCIAVLDSPFSENLIQRMNSYLMRLGVRDLDQKEIDNLLNAALPEKKMN